MSVNNVYQEYIADKHHLHMNATRWVTLTEFTKHLGRSGIVNVDETEKGLYISWIDNSPQALARQEAVQKKERQHMDDEQRERKLLAEQIERAKAQENDNEGEKKESILEKNPESGPLKLNLSTKNSGQSIAPAISFKGMENNQQSNNTSKPSNIFKASMKSSKREPSSNNSNSNNQKPKSAMESLMVENQERKRRIAERDTGSQKKVKL